MIIACPNCAARYRVTAAAFPESGRQVRCARCGHDWRAVPEASADEPAAGLPAVIETGGEPEDEAAERSAALGARLIPDDDDVGAADGEDAAASPLASAYTAARRVRAATAGRTRAASGRLGAFALGGALALTVAALHYRDQIVATVPSAGALYAVAGFEVNLRGLEFGAVNPRRESEDGIPVLVVEGYVTNVRGDAVPVPALRFALRDQERQEIYAWTVEPRTTGLEPGADMTFRTRLTSPPREAVDVQVRFADRRERTAGMRP